MSVFLRAWLFAITVLLIAEDFQYALKVGPVVVEQIENDIENEGIPEDCNENDEEEGEAQEEKSEDEKKVKDENKNADPGDDLLNRFSLLAKTKFRDALASHASIAHELESPPPEV